MPSLSIRLSEALIEQAQSTWQALPLIVRQQMESHHRHAIASGGWVSEREPFISEGIEVKRWQAKERSKEWLVLVEVALRDGLAAAAQDGELPAIERGGKVFNLALHDIEIERLGELQVTAGELKRGLKPGKGAAALCCIKRGLQLIAERYEVSQ